MSDSDDTSVYSDSDEEGEQQELLGQEAARLLHTDDMSSDDEDATGLNTVGRIPLHWYDAYDHVGYDVEGKKVVKRTAKDRIDNAIDVRDDPAARRTIYDMYNDREVVLSERDLEIIRRVQAGAFAHPEHNDTPDYSDYFSSIRELMPLSAAPEPKQRFLPSKWEMMRIRNIAKAMQEGRYVSRRRVREEPRPPVYSIWSDEDETSDARHKFHLPAPKMPLPGHAESYNPPPEYLLSPEEQAAMEALDEKERAYNFVPKKHDCLRRVAGYSNAVKERFERCLDLYLCPRKLKRRLNIDPETLVPRLPRPRELKPFPSALCLQFLGHSKAVLAISLAPDGQYLASASADGTVRLWELDTALCVALWRFDGVRGVQFNPNPQHALLAVVTETAVVFVATGTGDRDATELTDTLLGAALDAEQDEWEACESQGDTLRFGSPVGPRALLRFKDTLASASWHHKGDYLVTLCPSAGARAVSIHQLSKAKSQQPFSKAAGRVQAVAFHPARPFLFVATQQHVKVYNLLEQKMVKKLLSGCKWLSSLALHPSGDHVVVGSYDRRVVWFDLDLSSSPYKTLKFHDKAIRGVCFHRKYPLFASASDDGSVQVFHATVYNDLTRNPLLVPLKVLRGHGVKDGLSVLAVEFHPRQPWLITAGADGVINLFQDI